MYTYEDARKVTSIKGWFDNNDNIKTFNEFKYFIGLKNIEVLAFYKCSSLQSINIPNSVTIIAGYAFSCCESLRTIDIPDSVTNIGFNAFYSCISLQSISIPNKVNLIGNYAFYSCISLQTINIPDSVTSIRERAFHGCSSLQTINIPNSVTSIGIKAFSDCVTLESINIPNSVTSIGNEAFSRCEALQSIYISKDCPVYDQIRKEYPDIQLIEPKVNESSNLGLNKHVQKKFDKADAIDNISDYVDLGLPSGTLWCSHNYGVYNEYECGNLYNHVNATELDLLPGKLPSVEDFRELKNFCKHEISEVNGVKGMMFISKKNSNEIFFPIADHYEGLHFVRPYGYYWSSELYWDDGAYNMKFDLEDGSINVCNTSYRRYGFLVRTVLKKANESNLGLNNQIKKRYSSSAETIIEELGKYPGSLDESLDFFIKELLNDKEHNGENKWIENPDTEKFGENGSYHIRKKDLNDRNPFDFAPYGIIMYYRIGGMNLGLYFVLDENDHPCFLMSGFRDSFLNWAFDNDINIKTRLVSEVPDYRDRKISTFVNIFDCTFESLRGLATYLNKKYYDSNHPLEKSYKVNEDLSRKIKEKYVKSPSESDDIQLIEPKVNESTNLGLNKHVQDKFNKKDILEDFDEFVDLGIPSGVRWAKHNVGATTEEEYGDYYSYNDIDKLSRGNVRVPTNIEWSDLKRYCTIGFVSSGDGKKGLVVKSKKDPSKYIFLPSAGFACDGKDKSIVDRGINGSYMLSNIYRYTFHFNSNTNSVDFQSFNDFDICRFTVRMVEYPEKKKNSKKIEESSHLGLNKQVQKKYEKKDAIDNISNYVDLGLPSGNLWCKYNVGANSEEEYGDYFKHHQALAIDTKEGVLPLSSDFLELRQHCEETDETINGVKCRVFTSKHNRERLCFPAAGLNGVYKNVSGSYWAEDPYEGNDNRSWCMAFSFDRTTYGHKSYNDNFNNANEISVRLVLKKDKVNESSASLGMNKHVQKKFEDKDSVENVSLIQFKDKEVEKVCHEHGVYTFEDAASVTTIIDETQWFKPSWFYDHKIKTFDEFKYFTGLKTVERHAFNFNTTLESITLPSSIETIGFGAFKDCHNLVKVTIQEGLKTIKTCAFVNCRHLKTLVLPEGLVQIDSLFIEGCRNIKSVNIPDSVKYMSPTAFNECGESLNTIYISSNHHLRSALSENCPRVVLVDPKEVNESNLGLNKRVQKKFQDIDDIENLEFDYVDLGLPSGTLWCKHNYGATTEEEYGERHTFDEAQKLDVVVPSKEDFIELYNNCVYKVEYVNGIYGIRFISKKNEKSIFLPVGSSKDKIRGERYWSSTELSSESGYDLCVDYDLINPTNYNSKFFKYPVRPVKKGVKESNLGLNSKVKKKFEEDNEGDKALNQVRPVFDCVDDSGKPVEVHMSDADWKNKVFKWLYDNVDTLKIKEDDEYRAKRGHTTLKVDDFITNKYGGQISICLYHHEYSSYGHPSYIDRLADYFNGNPNFPLVLTAHDLGNYSFCAVKLWKQGTKWRLTSEAYYQDKYYSSKRCPNGAWKTAKKTVTSKDCPILLKIK